MNFPARAASILRRRNTRDKNPQLGAQHCFVASLGRCFPFFTLHYQLVAQQKYLSRVEESCCENRARVYSEQQILALLLVFLQAHNLSRNKCACVLANQPVSALHFFNPQQMFLLRVKLITQGEKSEISTKTCNQIMLRDKLRVFVSRISPPLFLYIFGHKIGVFNSPPLLEGKKLQVIHFKVICLCLDPKELCPIPIQ